MPVHRCFLVYDYVYRFAVYGYGVTKAPSD
jgi:hypothetical protein